MIAIQLSVGKIFNNTTDSLKWINYSAGVWYTNFNGIYTEVDDVHDEPYYNTETITIVSSVKSDFADLTEVSSIPDLHTEPSFYYNFAEKKLYIRLADYDDPDLHSINIGIARYYSNYYYVDSNASIYHDKLLEIGSVALSREKVVNGDSISFDRFNVSLNNADGTFDNFNTWDIYKQKASIYYLNQETGERVEIYKGYIWKYNINNQTLSLEIVDQRKGLDDDLIMNYYTQDIYANLHDDDVDKPMPVRYGLLDKVDVLCVNRGIYNPSSSQTLTFHIADTSIHNLSSATPTFYIDNVAKSISNYSASSGTFDYSKAADEEIDFNKCTISGYGYYNGMNIINPADICKDILLNISGVTYNTTNYNTTRWTEVRALLNNAFLDGTGGKVIDAIQSVLKQNATFIIDRDGRYSLSKQSTIGSAEYTIPKEHILNLTEISESYDVDEVYSSVNVKYANGKNYIYDLGAESVYERYRTNKTLEYESSLTTESDAAELAEEISNIVTQLRPLYNIVVPFDLYKDVALDDIISVQIDRVVDEWRGYLTCLVEGWTINPLDETITLNVRYVGDTVIQPYYYGQTYLYGETLYGGDIIGLPYYT